MDEETNHLTREFEFDPDATCKVRWTFTIPADDRQPRIENVVIEGYRQTEESRERGCLGHPRTIEALLTQRPLRSIDEGALAATCCVRHQSSGQALAHCIRRLKEEFGA